jgi:serine protease Do
VTEVSKDGPAAKKDIKPGDVIVALNGERINGSRDLARKTVELHSNTTVALMIMRYGERRQVEMTLGTLPASQKPIPLRLGFSAASLGS